MKKPYERPYKYSEKCFETSALKCGLTATPATGSRHFAYSYDTFTGHLGGGFSAGSTDTGQRVSVSGLRAPREATVMPGSAAIGFP